jgi:hypothetical protein
MVTERYLNFGQATNRALAWLKENGVDQLDDICINGAYRRM